MKRKVLTSTSIKVTLLRLHQNQYAKLDQETSLDFGETHLSRCDGR